MTSPRSRQLPVVGPDRPATSGGPCEPACGCASGTGSEIRGASPELSGRGTSTSAPAELWGRVKTILDLIRPAVQEDGGDVELVAVTADGQVQVRFHGACVGCPSSSITLQTGIERNLRLHVAEVTSVIAVV